MSALQSLTDREREIYLAEFAMCGAKTAHECEQWASRAVQMERAKMAGKYKITNGNPDSGRKGGKVSRTKSVMMPLNAAELGTLATNEAARVFSIEPSELRYAENIQARRWATVALAMSPAIGYGIRNVLGPSRAHAILGVIVQNKANDLEMLRCRNPMAYRRAIAFAKTLAPVFAGESQERAA